MSESTVSTSQTEAPAEAGEGEDTNGEQQATTEPQEGQESDDDEPADKIDAEDAWDAGRALTKIKKLNSELVNLRKRTREAEEVTQTKVPTLEAENLRLRVAVKHGLPEKIANRLQGETEEELLADAQELLETFTPKRPPTQRPTEQLRGGGDPTREAEPDIDKLALSQLST